MFAIVYRFTYKPLNRLVVYILCQDMSKCIRPLDLAVFRINLSHQAFSNPGAATTDAFHLRDNYDRHDRCQWIRRAYVVIPPFAIRQAFYFRTLPSLSQASLPNYLIIDTITPGSS